MTSFYSWRLMFMTFHGQTRADHHTFDHAHESPPSMLIPLAVLALGAAIAGFTFAPQFIGHGEAEFWGKALIRGEHNHILHAMHEIPSWVGFAPFLAMLTGFVIAYVYYIQAPWLPAATAKAFRPLYLFLLNKWYFDELYDWLFVKPAFAIGRLFWKGGDGAIIDGVDRRHGGGRRQGYGTRRQAADRLRLSLRLRHAHRRGAASHLLHVHQRLRGRFGQMNNILSVVTFLPLAGALGIALLNADAKGNARWIALWTTLITFALSLVIWVNFDKTNPGFQFLEEAAWIGGLKYKMGVDGISMLFVILTTFLMPLCILAAGRASKNASRNT